MKRPDDHSSTDEQLILATMRPDVRNQFTEAQIAAYMKFHGHTCDDVIHQLEGKDPDASIEHVLNCIREFPKGDQQMKRPDMTKYFAAYPVDVVPVKHEYKNWVGYYYQHDNLCLVTEFEGGAIARFQNVGDAFDYEGMTMRDVLNSPDPPEIFVSLDAMIYCDRDVTT